MVGNLLIKDCPFAQVPSSAIWDKRIKLPVLGMWTFMWNLPNNWKYSIVGLAKAKGCGIYAAASAVKILEKYGYLKRVQRREKGKFMGFNYVLVAKPDTENEKTVSGKPDDGKSVIRENRQRKTADNIISNNLISNNPISKKIKSINQAIINKDDIDDFIQKSNERFQIQLNRTLVTEFLETANNDLSIVYKAIEKTVAAARSQSSHIRSVRAYVTKTIKSIVSENDDIEYDAVKVAEEERDANREKAKNEQEKRAQQYHERLMNESVNEKKCDTIHEIHEKAERQRNSIVSTQKKACEDE